LCMPYFPHIRKFSRAPNAFVPNFLLITAIKPLHALMYAIFPTYPYTSRAPNHLCSKFPIQTWQTKINNLYCGHSMVSYHDRGCFYAIALPSFPNLGNKISHSGILARVQPSLQLAVLAVQQPLQLFLQHLFIAVVRG